MDATPFDATGTLTAASRALVTRGATQAPVFTMVGLATISRGDIDQAIAAGIDPDAATVAEHMTWSAVGTR